MSLFKKLLFFVSIFLRFSMQSTNSLTLQGIEDRKDSKAVFDLFFNIGGKLQSENGHEGFFGRLDCPSCDSSVYSYCSEKLLHDACCCLNPYEHKLPYECKFADCSFLHANSCREHKLITACCCSKKHH